MESFQTVGIMCGHELTHVVSPLMVTDPETTTFGPLLRLLSAVFHKVFDLVEHAG